MPSADFFVQPCATEIVTARNTESTKPRISDRSGQATRPIPPLSTMTAQRRPRREFSPQPPKAMEHFPACRGCQTFDYEIFEASKISHANSLISWCDDDNIHHRSAFATGCLIATLGPPVPRSGKKSPPPARFASNAGPVGSTRTGPRDRCDFFGYSAPSAFHKFSFPATYRDRHRHIRRSRPKDAALFQIRGSGRNRPTSDSGWNARENVCNNSIRRKA